MRILDGSAWLTFLVAISFGAAACAPPSGGGASRAETQTPPTARATAFPVRTYEQSDLLGIWHQDGVDTLVSFHADGTFARDAAGKLWWGPGSTGRFGIHDSQVTFDVATGSCPGGLYVWETDMPEDGLLSVVVLEDTTCWAAQGLRSTWSRLSPFGRWQPPVPESLPADRTVPAGAGNLRGIWYQAGNSALISLTREATFAYDDRGNLDTHPMDTGSWEISGGNLTLTSGKDSVACSEGDILVMEDARVFWGTPFWLIGRVVRDTCGRLDGEFFLAGASS